MGMYGIFRVDPKGYEGGRQEYFLTMKEWDSRLNRQMAGQDVTYDVRNRRPDTFTINGKCAPGPSTPKTARPSSSNTATRSGSTSATTGT